LHASSLNYQFLLLNSISDKENLTRNNFNVELGPRMQGSISENMMVEIENSLKLGT